MGTPLPDRIDGELCSLCWGPGRAFGDHPTPRVVQITLADLLPGEFWSKALEALYLTPTLLYQTASPCVWENANGALFWKLTYDLFSTQMLVTEVSTGRRVFLNTLNLACLKSINSGLTNPSGNIAYSGWAFFDLSQEN